ncbi:hypothetical protein [Nafulsella turpanensis]|uniref:hypothetical protein n=1 Tax=Nafulsella turpanensis TaxID=1265690 RepID=UPI00034BB030|nr:hypothetical protein [Nafulsella turpanensis]
MIAVSKQRVWLIFFTATYALLLYFQLGVIIAPEVGEAYPAYTIKDNSWINVLSFVTVIGSTFLVRLQERIDNIIVNILYTIVFIPSLVYIPLVTSLPLTEKIFALLVLILSMIILMYGIRLKSTPVNLKLIQLRFPKLFIALLFFFFIAYLIIRLGPPTQLVNPFDVYGKRAEFKESLKEVNDLIVSYSFTWISYALAPILITIGLNKEKQLAKVLFISSGFIGLLIVYLYSGLKSSLFSTFFILAIYYLTKRKLNFTLAWLQFVVIFFSAANILYFVGAKYIALHVVRRFFVIPGMNFSFFYEYFSQSPKVKLSHSIFSSFVDYPYHADPPHLIGEKYYGSIETSANANYLADAFSNFGIIGCVLYSFLLVIVIKVLQSSTNNLSHSLVLPSIFIIIYSLANSGLLTALLTYGLILYILIVRQLNKTSI